MLDKRWFPEVKFELSPRGDYFAACANGDVEFVAKCLDAGLDPNTQDSSGSTGATFAAFFGQALVFHLLADRGADLQHTANRRKQSIAHEAYRGLVVCICSDLATIIELEYPDEGTAAAKLSASIPKVFDYVSILNRLAAADVLAYENPLLPNFVENAPQGISWLFTNPERLKVLCALDQRWTATGAESPAQSSTSRPTKPKIGIRARRPQAG